MRYIDLSKIDTSDSDVISWLTQARQKYSELASKPDHTSRSVYLSTNNLWSSFKPILIRYFGNKCWYSESSLEGSFGDVDHFRPKNQSTDTQGNSILNDGYWWLAYEYLNYRLSCEKCNRPYGDGGKGNYFPLKQGTQPTEFNAPIEETYLLLDPCNEHDVEIIGYNEEGRAIPLTNDQWEIKRVKNSRWIYNLDCFNSARKEIQCRCRVALEIFEMLYEVDPSKTALAIQNLYNYTKDSAPYASVAKQYISLKIEGKPYAEELSRMLKIS